MANLYAAMLGVVMSLGPISGAATAQDRLPPIAADQLTPEQKQAVTEFKSARGVDINGPFIPMLRSPEAMSRARAMGDYLRYKSALPPRLSEFVILLTAREWTQNYEWKVHYPIAVQAGVKPETAQAIAEGRRPSAMTDEEAALYDFCTELQRTRTVGDGAYNRLLATLGEKGVIDTISIVGYYSLLAMVMNTARTPAPVNDSPTLSALPH